MCFTTVSLFSFLLNVKTDFCKYEISVRNLLYKCFKKKCFKGASSLLTLSNREQMVYERMMKRICGNFASSRESVLLNSAGQYHGNKWISLSRICSVNTKPT